MRVPFSHLLLFAFLLWPVAASAGDSAAEAGLGLGSEYNDNVRESAANAKTDFITHIKPAFKLSHTGGRSSFSADYRGDYMFYNRGSKKDDYLHYLKAAFAGEVVENLLFLDITQDLQPVYSNAVRGDTIEGDGTTDLVNKNRFEVSPYCNLHLSDRTDTRFGYRFTDLRYSEGNNRNHPIPGLNNEYDFSSKVSQQHTVFTETNHALTDRIDLKAGLDGTRHDVEKARESDANQSLTRYKAYVGGAWKLSEDATVQVLAGPSYTVPDDGKEKLRPYVNSSVVWVVGRSEFGLAYDMDYFDDPETGGSKSRTSSSTWWTKNFERARLTARLEYRRYDRPNGGTEESYRPSIFSSYDISERLSATASATAENISGGNTTNANAYYTSLGLNYQLSESSRVSLTYRNKIAEKSGTREGYDVNRLMLEAYVAF